MSKRAELRRAAKVEKQNSARFYVTQEQLDEIAYNIAKTYIKQYLEMHAKLMIELYRKVMYQALDDEFGFKRHRLARVERRMEKLMERAQYLKDKGHYDEIYDFYDSLGADAKALAAVPKDYQRYEATDDADGELVIEYDAS